MYSILPSIQSILTQHGFSQSLAFHTSICISLIGVFFIAIFLNLIIKSYILRIVKISIQKTKQSFLKICLTEGVFSKLAQLIPIVFTYQAIQTIITPGYSYTELLAHVVQVIMSLYAVILITLTISSLLNSFYGLIIEKAAFKDKPIKSYIQVIKIILWIIAAVLILSIAINQSPWKFLTGIGALSAVLLLVFKDTILGFVASIQVTAYDMVRVGDWVVLPKEGANGTVIDLSINTVKIQNFDHTIVTIPTYDLVSKGVQNWRGMVESGGRRIKRSICIDIDSIHFCDEQLIQKLLNIELLKPHLNQKLTEIKEYNHNLPNQNHDINSRRLSNIGLFRAYTEAYLRENQHIAQDMTFIVRQLEAKQFGLPIQIYVFTNDTNWVNYEAIQSDIFDHLFAVVPYFELKIYQATTGRMDIQN